MRIIAGIAKGRKIKTPSGLSVRPTLDKVRGAIFDTLGDRVHNARFLDLFSGTGALGIEALSRGARKVIFVEKSSRMRKLIEENLKLAGLDSRPFVIRVEALSEIERLRRSGARFDIIVLDPPYQAALGRGRSRLYLAEKTLQAIEHNAILAPDGVLVAEHPLRRSLDFVGENLKPLSIKKYGSTAVSFFGWNP